MFCASRPLPSANGNLGANGTATHISRPELLPWHLPSVTRLCNHRSPKIPPTPSTAAKLHASFHKTQGWKCKSCSHSRTRITGYRAHHEHAHISARRQACVREPCKREAAYTHVSGIVERRVDEINKGLLLHITEGVRKIHCGSVHCCPPRPVTAMLMSVRGLTPLPRGWNIRRV